MTDDKPWDTRIPSSTPDGTAPGMPVQIPDTCAICEEEFEFGGWTMIHGETECKKCGTPYQIKPLNDEDWDDVPRHKIEERYVEPVKKCYKDTGTIKTFDDWIEDNPEHNPSDV